MRGKAILALCALLVGLAACTAAPVIQVEEKEVQAGDVTLHARIAGAPEAQAVLVAIHGGPGMSSHYMVSLERLAGPDLAVVTYDQRGAGRSSSPAPEPANYELLDYVADLDAVRRAVGADRVHLLGHSWGGIVAMHYATVHPERVRSIVLLGSGPPAWGDIAAGQRRLQGRIQALQRGGVISATLPRDGSGQAQAILPAYFSDPTFWFSPDDGGPPEYNDTANRLTWSAIGPYDLSAGVAGLNHRVLILWGEDDPFGLPMAEATRAALSAAQVEFVLLDNCGHFWHECPDPFFQHVRAFLGLSPEP